MKEIIVRQNSLAISLPSSSCFATTYMSLLVIAREFWWMNQKWLENQMVMHNRSEMVMV
jgi:hypothetical protein